jgi:4-amino-4-deoxy-L-arabinose transferase-like glycosyltransferase
VLLIAALLAAATLLRLTGIAEPSVEQRETQSGLLARQWYLDDADVPAWQRRVLDELPRLVKPIEPPVLDVLTAWQWRLVDGENFWFPRLVSSLFWVGGGVFLYLIARRLTTRDGAIAALALYLAWPFAVWLSRHFMPDALMVCLLLAAALAVIRYWERPTRGRLLAAAGVSAVATAVKPGVAFLYLAGLFLGLAVWRRGLRRSLTGGHFPLYALVSVSLAGGYYVYGRFFSDFIWSGADAGRVTPGSVLNGWFWADWWEAVSALLRWPQEQQALALLPLAAGAAGLALARGRARAVFAGLVLGYVAFALTAANYVSGNPYYSLPLIAILALSIGALVGAVVERASAVTRHGRPAVLALVAGVVAVAAYKSHAVLAGVETTERITDYRQIGDATGHTTRAVVVDDELSTPAMYWGWLVGRSWEDVNTGSLPPHIEADDPEFLIVVGEGRLESSPALQHFTRSLDVVQETDRWAVFRLTGTTASD